MTGKFFASAVLVAVGVSISVACPEDYADRVDEHYFNCMQRYDQISQQKPIKSEAQMKRVLATLTTKSYQQLDPQYVEHAQLNREFRLMNRRTGRTRIQDYRKKRFYEVKGNDQFKYLVGHLRIVDFLPNWKSPNYAYDPFHEAARELACTDESQNAPQYLLLDSQLLTKVQQLINLLDNHPNNYDHEAFDTYYAFRHPHMNDAIEGAKHSQHLWGKALDIRVGDIDRDGMVSRRDKAIVLELLERKVIGRSGGIGRYPDSDTDIHIDVRGSYARWDTY